VFIDVGLEDASLAMRPRKVTVAFGASASAGLSFVVECWTVDQPVSPGAKHVDGARQSPLVEQGLPDAAAAAQETPQRLSEAGITPFTSEAGKEEVVVLFAAVLFAAVLFAAVLFAAVLFAAVAWVVLFLAQHRGSEVQTVNPMSGLQQIKLQFEAVVETGTEGSEDDHMQGLCDALQSDCVVSFEHSASLSEFMAMELQMPWAVGVPRKLRAAVPARATAA